MAMKPETQMSRCSQTTCVTCSFIQTTHTEVTTVVSLVILAHNSGYILRVPRVQRVKHYQIMYCENSTPLFRAKTIPS